MAFSTTDAASVHNADSNVVDCEFPNAAVSQQRQVSKAKEKKEILEMCSYHFRKKAIR